MGPRPCLPSQLELIEARQENGVYAIRPGITGPSQLDDIDMSTPIKLAISDGAYVRERTFIKDMKYIALTVLGRGSGDAVPGAGPK